MTAPDLGILRSLGLEIDRDVFGRFEVHIGRVMNPLRAVVFDTGETLVDESRIWSELAHRAGVTPFALMGVLGSLIERGRDHNDVWRVLGVARPTILPEIEIRDFYPDALACLEMVQARRLTVGIAGNQPDGAVEQLVGAGIRADFIASSAAWGVAKPSPQFFERVCMAAQSEPQEILYVGDRLDNDILPARAIGMRTALIRRGPWGFIHAQRAEAELANNRLDSLAQLSTMLDTWLVS